jgi:RNA polymerase sigma factor (sigma-70 family)
MPPKPTNVVSIDSGNHRAKVLAARDALVTAHLDLVQTIASHIVLKLPPSFERDDLVSTGYIALIAAATRYRPDFPTAKVRRREQMPFRAYAWKKIHGAMWESTRRVNWKRNTMPPISPLTEAPEPTSEPMLERRVRLAIRDLPRHLQRVIALHYFHDVPLQEIAAVMGVKGARISQIKREAHEALAERLRDVA